MNALLACAVAVAFVTVFPSMWFAILIALIVFAALDLTGSIK